MYVPLHLLENTLHHVFVPVGLCRTHTSWPLGVHKTFSCASNACAEQAFACEAVAPATTFALWVCLTCGRWSAARRRSAMYPNSRNDLQGPSSDSHRSFYPIVGQPQQRNQSPPAPPPPLRHPSPAAAPSNGSQHNPLLRVQIAEPYRTLPPVGRQSCILNIYRVHGSALS